jgi:membrane fusion protein, multidrug efflux system
VTDTVSAVHFQDGQKVLAGAPLVEMTNAEERAQLSEMRSRVREARLQYDRARELVKDRTLAQSVTDARRRDYDTAQAQLSAMQSRLKDRLIVAPFAGVLGLRQVSVGSLVQPSTVITTLDDIRRMKCDFTVPSAYMAMVREGLAMSAISDAYDGKVFEGKVVAVDSRLDETTRQVRVRAVIDNPEALLLPGLNVQVTLLGAPRKALVVPEGAIVPLGSEHYVYLATSTPEGMKAVRTKVVVRARHGALVEISSGLKEGDKVVSEGTMLLTDGKAVALRTDNAPASAAAAPASTPSAGAR